MCVHRAIAEKEILEALDAHPFIVGLHDSFLENNTSFLLFDYAAGGTLKQHLDAAAVSDPSNGRRLPRKMVRDFICELVMAVDHLQVRY